MKLFVFSLQQIDEMLAGSLSQEDEDAVLAELEALTQVGIINISVFDSLNSCFIRSLFCVFKIKHVSSLFPLRETSSFPKFLKTNFQKSPRPQRRKQVCSL